MHFKGSFPDPNNQNNGWWVDTTAAPTQPNYDEFGVQITSPDTRNDAWDTDFSVWGTAIDPNTGLEVEVEGSFKVSDKGLYKGYLEDLIELYEDCDIDCQAKGSQITLIASLMGTVYGIVGLNALFMFIGTWRYRWRVCSVYCTFFACLFQFAILCAAGSMLFTKYNAICARSMYNVGDPFMWTMADDFYMIFVTWIFSFIWMFVFVCCGLCSAYRVEK